MKTLFLIWAVGALLVVVIGCLNAADDDTPGTHWVATMVLAILWPIAVPVIVSILLHDRMRRAVRHD